MAEETEWQLRWLVPATGTSTTPPAGSCSSGKTPADNPVQPVETLPVLGAAIGAALVDCASLAAVPGAYAGKPVGAHCQVRGSMYQRTSPVAGQNYAIGFEIRRQ